MIDIEVDVDTEDAALFIRGVNLKAIPVAEVRALNKVIVTVRKEASAEVRKKRRLKIGEIKKSLPITRARRGMPEARVRGSRRPIPLKRYAAKMSGRKGNKHVVINVTGQREILRHAFILDKVGGRAVGHVFERKGEGTLPIRKLFGPSIGSALVDTSVKIAMRRVVSTSWPIVYRREVEFVMKKLKR